MELINKAVYELQIRHLVQTIKTLNEIDEDNLELLKAVATRKGIKQGIKLEAIEESLSVIEKYINTDIEEILRDLEVLAKNEDIQEIVKESLKRAEKKMYGNH